MQIYSSSQRERDLRIDFLRGLALLIIFSDHVVGNPIRDFMPISLGFSDLAEVFVFLSGCVCGMAYPLPQDRKQFWKITRRLMTRALRVYLALVLMLGVSWLLIVAMGEFTGGKLTAADFGCPPIDSHVGHAIENALELKWLPRNYCVLAVYLPFLVAVPLILILLRWSVAVTMAISIAVYLCVQLLPEVVSLPEPWRSAWYFNPVAWQLVFVFGIACGKRDLGIVKSIPQGIWWILLAAAGLEGAFMYKMLWPPDVFPMTEKATLGVIRIVHFFCVLIVGRAVVRTSAIWQNKPLRPIILCGQHPLAAYCSGGICASLGTGTLRMFGANLPLVAAVNLIGWLFIAAVAVSIHRLKWHQTATVVAPLDKTVTRQAAEAQAELAPNSPLRE